MIIRLFRARLKPDARAAYTQLCYETAIPMMQGQPGCHTAYIAPLRDESPNDFIVVSLWSDIASLRAFVGEAWTQAIIMPGEADLLETARVEHYDGSFRSLMRLWEAHADVLRRREAQVRNMPLTDRQWDAIKAVIPPPRRRGRPPADDRRTLEGILYVLRNGCRWQDTPKEFGSAVTCWRRFDRWEADGTWERVWQTLWGELEPAARHVWARALLDCARIPNRPGRARSAATRAKSVRLHPRPSARAQDGAARAFATGGQS